MTVKGLKNIVVLIRGAGEIASGVAHRVHRSGFRLIMTEIKEPIAVRRKVSYCEAVHDGVQSVEGVTARLAGGWNEIQDLWKKNQIPVLIDPEMSIRTEVNPDVIVDALLAKQNTGLNSEMASLTIGLGPGFSAPDTVHVAIETNRGHNLGRLIYKGEPELNTGIPGDISGHTVKRVLRAPTEGVFKTKCSLGDRVELGQVVASVNGEQICPELSGILRGLIRDKIRVRRNQKVGDVDPRSNREYVNTISEKSRAIGGSVLEAILARFNKG